MNFNFIQFRVILAGIVGYYFAQMFLYYLPLFFFKPIFVAALPLLMVLVILFISNPITPLVLVFLSRASMDTFLAASRVGVGGGTSTGIGGLINLLVVLFVFFFVVGKAERLKEVPLKASWALFLLVCAASLTLSPQKGTAVKLLFNLLSYGCVFTLPFYLVNDRASMRFWVKVLLASTALPVLASIVDLARGGQYFPDAGMRIAGTFNHPNILAFYLVFATALVFYILRSGVLDVRGANRVFLSLYLFTILMLLVITKTRSAWLSVWVFFLVYGLLSDRRFLILTLIVPPILLVHPAIRERVQDAFHSTGHDVRTGLNSLAWRQELWKRSMIQIRSHWLTGQGLESFRPLSKYFFPFSSSGVDPHNSYLQVMFETGIVGLTAFVSLFLGVLARFWRVLWARMGRVPLYAVVGFGLMLGYALTCASDNMLYYLSYNWYFWFMIALLMRTGQLESER